MFIAFWHGIPTDTQKPEPPPAVTPCWWCKRNDTVTGLRVIYLWDLLLVFFARHCIFLARHFARQFATSSQHLQVGTQLAMDGDSPPPGVEEEPVAPGVEPAAADAATASDGRLTQAGPEYGSRYGPPPGYSDYYSYYGYPGYGAPGYGAPGGLLAGKQFASAAAAAGMPATITCLTNACAGAITSNNREAVRVHR